MGVKHEHNRDIVALMAAMLAVTWDIKHMCREQEPINVEEYNDSKPICAACFSLMQWACLAVKVSAFQLKTCNRYHVWLLQLQSGKTFCVL